MSDIDVNDFLAGSGAPSAQFPEIGAEIEGDLISAEVRQQTKLEDGSPLVWNDGKPRLQLVVTLDVGETGEYDTTERRLYAKGEMLKAIKEAVKVSGGKFENGGRLKVRYTGDGDQKVKGHNPPRLYKAKWTPPSKAAPSVADLDDL